MRHDGFHGRVGFGQRPALIVVDVNRGFTDPESPLVCDLDEVVAAIQRLLGEMRRAGLPVVYTTVSYGEGGQSDRRGVHRQDSGAARRSRPAPRWVEIDPRIAPLRGEPVLNKLFASAFFGTALSSFLAANACDSLIVTGASTSGCVRATVVDAIQHGYRPVVPREAVGDRNPDAHAANLYDIDTKYGDVVSVDDVLVQLEDWQSVPHTLAEKILLGARRCGRRAARRRRHRALRRRHGERRQRACRLPRHGADGCVAGLRPGEGRDGRGSLHAREGRALGGAPATAQGVVGRSRG